MIVILRRGPIRLEGQQRQQATPLSPFFVMIVDPESSHRRLHHEDHVSLLWLCCRHCQVKKLRSADDRIMARDSLAIDARRIARLAELFDQFNDGLSPEQYVSACASSDPVCDIIRGRLNRRHSFGATDFDRGTSRYFSGKRWKGPSG